MVDVFLSYARKDRIRAVPILNALREEGFSVWWDLKILPGTSWRTVLRKMLAGTRCVVVLWSKTSVESSWVLEEADNASRRGLLVPALIDDIDPPLGFGEVQCARIAGFAGDRADPGFQELCAAIRAKVTVAAAVGAGAASGEPGGVPLDRPAETDPEPETRDAPSTGPYCLPARRSSHRRWRWTLPAVAAVAIAAAVWIWITRSPAVIHNSTDGLVYRRIPAGSFTMGCQADCELDEVPARRVTLSRPFWISETEVTVGAYHAFARAAGRPMPHPPAFDPAWHNQDHPIVNVSYWDAEAYCRWAGGELPTEAQWEYAARGGTTSRFPWGDSISREKANYGYKAPDGSIHPRASESGARDRWLFTSPVRSFEPNAYGLYDMVGNVQEWCRDAYRPYADLGGTDPYAAAANNMEERVVRGGSFLYDQQDCRPENRSKNPPQGRYPDSGFRCILAGR